MNKQIQEIHKELDSTNKNEFIIQLYRKTRRSISTIHVHWLGKVFTIPSDYEVEALKIANKLKKNQDRIRNIEVNL